MAKYHIITFGCQMNKSDSERIAGVFERLNYQPAEDMQAADILVVNACSVRQTAIDRIWGVVKKFSQLKGEKKYTTILTGCLLPSDRIKFRKRFDLVFNIKKLLELENFLDARESESKEKYFEHLPRYAVNFQAHVPVMTGCNNYCSYCVVPYVRGRETSRKVKDILKEIQALVKNGCKQVDLLGQNVNSYEPDDKDCFSKQNPFQQNFAKLLWEINQIENIERVNFMSSHPKDLHDDVIRALALPKMVNYLHLALQSGDNQVLGKMNRKYTIKDFEKLITKVRKVKPEIAIGTDIIVGFAGETRVQFENTLKFYKKIRFDISYNAMFSLRRGTAAAKFDDDVFHEEKKRRWHELQIIMEKITLEINQKYLGKMVSVLIDTKEKDFCDGNSLEMKRVRIKNCQAMPGDIVQVKIKQAREWMLFA